MNFYQTVYALARQIPRGRVATYGQLAFLAGSPRASRVVGGAMRRCPAGAGVPCHRVVGRDGRLAPEGAFGPLDEQRLLLEAEGVEITPDRRVDLQRYRWDGTLKTE